MDVISHLRVIDFMAHLREEDLQALAQICRRQRFIAGEDILRQGDLTHSFFIVDEGRVHFRKTDMEGFEHPVSAKSAGEYFGKEMFSTQAPAELTAEALGQAALYVIERESFDKLCEVNPDLLKHLPEIDAARKNLTRGFKWLLKDELIALVAYRHKIVLLQVLVLPVLVGLVSVLFGIGVFTLPWGGPAMWVVVIIGLVIAIGWGALAALDWKDDVLIVTNKRLVRSERELYITEVRREIPLNQIQSISIRKAGILQTLFGISTLEIQSAGSTDSRIVFDRAADTENTKRVIQRQQDAQRARQQAQDRERVRQRVGSELHHYVLQLPMEEKPALAKKSGKRSMLISLRELWHELFAYEINDGFSTTWRKHWWGLVGHTKRWLIFALALLVIMWAYFSGLHNPISAGPVAFFGVLVLFDLLGLVYEWVDWRNDIYRVTDRAVVDIERKPLGLSSSYKEALLVNIQDVKAQRPKLINALLHFGNVEVRVAGDGEPLIFYNVSYPEKVSSEIFHRLETFRNKQREREVSMQSRNIVDALVAYHRLLMTERHSNVLPENVVSSVGTPPETLSSGTTNAALPESATSVEPVPPLLTSSELSEFPPIEEEE